MIKSFADKETEKLWGTGRSRKFPVKLHRRTAQKLQMLNAVTDVEDLRVPPSNMLEALKGKLKGYWSIRINDQYRIIFRFEGGNAFAVQVIDYH